MMPVVITEIYGIMEKIKCGVKIDEEKVHNLMQEVIRDETNFGTWIRRELDNKINYTSIVIISRNPSGEKKVIGYRVEEK